MHSEKDFYLKALKVFGAEARRALPLLRQAGCPVQVDPEHQAVQFHPRDLHHLQGDPELGVSYQIDGTAGRGAHSTGAAAGPHHPAHPVSRETYKNRQEEKEMREWNNN